MDTNVGSDTTLLAPINRDPRVIQYKEQLKNAKKAGKQAKFAERAAAEEAAKRKAEEEAEQQRKVSWSPREDKPLCEISSRGDFWSPRQEPSGVCAVAEISHSGLCVNVGWYLGGNARAHTRT